MKRDQLIFSPYDDVSLQHVAPTLLRLCSVVLPSSLPTSCRHLCCLQPISTSHGSFNARVTAQSIPRVMLELTYLPDRIMERDSTTLPQNQHLDVYIPRNNAATLREVNVKAAGVSLG